jgi:hypothetical protein
VTQKAIVNGQRALEEDLELLAEQYHDEPDSLSHQDIAEAIGRSFAQQCLHQYGIKGYQMAGTGIKAILDTLQEKKLS